MKNLFFALLLSGAPSFAALPPFTQSIKEIRALLSDPQLFELLGSAEPVLAIQRIEGGYEIETLHYRFKVAIIYGSSEEKSPLHVGPTSFSFVFPT